MNPGKYNKIALILAIILIVAGGFFVFQEKAIAATGINEQINFQGKLVSAAVGFEGTNIPDGTYNMEFKIYQDGDGVPGGGDETLKWTEDRLRNNSQGVTVTDGIFQVNLGSVTAFSGIDWNQTVLWVSINVGNTNPTCTPFSNCVPDGEMDPMVRFTAAPYAINAGNLEGKTWEVPGQIGLTTQNTGNFTTLNADSISTDTGGVSIAVGQSYSGAGAVTLSSTTNGLTLDSGINILTIDSSDTALTASGVTTLTLAANTTITNASGDISLQAAGTGTANVQIGDGGATSATPDLLVLDVGSAEPAGTVGAMYYSTALTKFRCYQGAAWADCIGTGGVGPWTDSGPGTLAYLTTLTENLAVGASSLVAPFSVNELTNTVRIGEGNAGAVTNGILAMYASDDDTGTITYTTNDSWDFEGGNVGIGDASPASLFTVGSGDLFQVNSSGNVTGGTYNGNTITTGTGTVTLGSYTLALTGSANLNQNLLTTSAPTFDGLTFTGAVTLNDDELFQIGTSADAVILNRSASLTANTALAGVFVGTPVVGAISANSTIFSNITADADMVFAANSGGNSTELLRLSAATSAIDIGAGDTSMVIDANGQVGIGDSSPDQLLEIMSSGAANTQLTISNTNAGNYNPQIGFELADGTNTFTMGVDNADSNKFKISTTALGTNDRLVIDTGTLTFANSTATDDTLGFNITTGGAGRFAGTLTNADLTGVHSWILPNLDGTVALTSQTHAQHTDTGTTQTTFNIGSGTNETANDITLSFGNSAPETLIFDGDSTDNFLLSDDLNITGGLTASLTITANGGISLSASQSLTAGALSYVDLGLIVHNTTAVQGLRLPQAASATPSNPTSGEGYLAWDVAGNQLITYNGTAWATVGGGSQTPWTGNIDADNFTLTDLGTNITARAGLTIASTGAGGLTLDSATGRVTIATSDFLNLGVSGVAGAAAGDIWYDTAAGKFKINETSGGTKILCNLTDGGCGAGGSADLQTTYGNDADGSNATISLTAADDSVVVSNPASSGTDNAFTFKVEQLNTGIANDAVYIDNRGTGNALRIDDTSGDTTPFIVDSNGSVGVGTSSTNGSMFQVGSAANRGDSKFYGDITKQGIINKKAISGTIKDVYVYDTTRDADGGRWIDDEKAQGLSWYAETKDNTGAACVIGTDDRCGKSAFPAKAIIVATTNAVYIFDANDNTMWMQFTQTGTYALGGKGGGTDNNPSSVFMLNGVLYVGTNGTNATGMYAIDFLNDRLYNYDATDRTMGDKNIFNRNTAVSYATNPITKLDLGTSAAVNDVHGAVLYGSSSIQTNSAALNGATFICAATEDGISVINISSGVVLTYGDNASDAFSACFVTRRARLYGINSTLMQVERYGPNANSQVPIDTAIANQATPTDVWDEQVANVPVIGPIGTVPTINASPDTLEVIERGSLASTTATEATTPYADIIYVGHGGALAEIHDVEAPSTSLIGWSKIRTTTYETPYMSGNPKGVFTFHETAYGANSTLTDPIKANVLTGLGHAPTIGVNGVHNTAVNFDGSSQYLCTDQDANGVCALDTDFDPGAALSFYVELWFRTPAGTVGPDTLIDRSLNATVAGYYVQMTNTGTITAIVRDGTNTDTATTTQTFNDGQWHHLALTRVSAAATGLAAGTWLYIDGRLAGSDTTYSAALTLNGATSLAIGASCTLADCSTAANFWTGDIDDVYISNTGATAATTTSESINGMQVRRKYLEGRQALQKRTIKSSTATSGTSTSLDLTGAAWVLNDYIGGIAEITSGTCSGQTRAIVSNDSDTLNVASAWASCTPDGTSVFEVQPEQLYGSSNNVTAVGLVDNTFLGETRKLYVGTNNGTDGGGISVWNGMGNSFVEKVYHSDASLSDDSSTTWSGADYDDIQSIGSNGSSVTYGSIAHIWTQTDTISMNSTVEKLVNNINSIRSELAQDGLAGTSHEIGMNGGADLAEYYKSPDPLEAGMIVATGDGGADTIKKTSGAYQKDLLGVVATAPGMILGTQEENSYPVALVGRVPVNVSTENGSVLKGDQITSGSLPGYGMLAVEAGRVIGTALEDMKPENFGVCPGDENINPAPERKCGQVTAFINLTDYLGIPISELAQNYYDKAGQENNFNDLVGEVQNGGEALAQSQKQGQAFNGFEKEENILEYLEKLKKEQAESGLNSSSEIFAGKLIAKDKIISPDIFAENIFAKSIKADKIEGLEFIQTGLNNAQSASEENSNNLRNLGGELDALQKKIGEMTASQNSGDQEKVLSVNSLEGLITGGVLAIEEQVEFKNETVFQKVARFFGKVIFGEDVEFAGRAVFNNDTAGYAVIKEGEDKVEINFEKEYAAAPVVNASLSLQQIKNNEVRQASEDLLLISDVKFIITNVTTKGFEIKIGQEALSDIPFSWQAVAVKDAKTFAKDNAAPDNNGASADNNPENISLPVEAVSPAEANSEMIIPAPAAPVSASENTAVVPENQTVSAAADVVTEPASATQ